MLTQIRPLVLLSTMEVPPQWGIGTALELPPVCTESLLGLRLLLESLFFLLHQSFSFLVLDTRSLDLVSLAVVSVLLVSLGAAKTCSSRGSSEVVLSGYLVP